MTNAILRGKPDAGNPHVRFDEGEVASAKPRRGSLLYKKIMLSLASAVACAYAGATTLSNDLVQIGFDGAGRLVRLQNRLTGHEWTGGGDVWRMFFDWADGEKEVPVVAAEQRATVVRDGNSIVIEYPSLECRGKQLRMRLRLAVTLESSGLIRFSSSLVNDEPHTCVRELQYPLVGDCRLPKDAVLFLTSGGGSTVKDPAETINRHGNSPPYMSCAQFFRQFDYKYPRWCAANCYALWNEEEGLYVGSHDPTFQETWHLFRAYPGEEGSFNRLEFGLAKYPQVQCGESWSNDCNVLSPYRGTWHRTAEIYRQWVNTWWQKRQPPEWVRTMTGWQRVIFRHQYGETFFIPADLDGRIRDCADRCDIDALFAFGWWRAGMDNGYPDSYFDVDETWGGDAGWKTAIRRWRERGRRFILYFNGKLIDRSSDFWRKGLGPRVCFSDANGGPFSEQYLFKAHGTFTGFYNARMFSVADSRNPEWKEFCHRAVDRAIDFGADSVFFDQLAQATTVNWSRKGEFPVAHLTVIADKANLLRELRDHVVAKGTADMAIGTEGFCDVCAQNVDWIHNFDPPNFARWSRYAFPECIISDRAIRDDTDIPRRVNMALSLGFRSDVEIYRARDLIDKCPNYMAYLAKANALRRKFPILLTGTYRDTIGVVVTGQLDARAFAEGDQTAVIVTGGNEGGGSGRIGVPGKRLVGYDKIGSAKIHLDGRVELPPDGLAVLLFK